LMVQVARPPSMPPQLFVSLKSPLGEMLVIVKLELELFVSVTGSAVLVIVRRVPGNVRLEGLAVSAGTTVSIPITEVVPVIAVTVTGVELLTTPAVTKNV